MEKTLRASFTDFLGDLFIKDELDENIRNTARFIIDDCNPTTLKVCNTKADNLIFVENHGSQFRVYKDREVAVKDGYVTDTELGYIKVPLHKYLYMLKKANIKEKILLNYTRFSTNSLYII